MKGLFLNREITSKKALDLGYDSRPDSNYNSEELKKGIEIEFEHTSRYEISKMIAKDHLDEIPDYYTRLIKMEADYETSISK